MKNLAHSYVQLLINNLRKVYKHSYEVLKNKTYKKNSLEYKMHKQLLNQTEDTLSKLKRLRITITVTYQNYALNKEYLLEEVKKEVDEIIETLGKIDLNIVKDERKN